MSPHPSDLHLPGQQLRVSISDQRIIAPNAVEIIDNGLSMGPSIASLRVMDPLKGRAYYVPLTIQQVDELSRHLLVIMGEAHDNHKERS